MSCRQPDRQRMNDLWKKIYLMMLGYLSSLTYSVFIHLLTLSLPLSLHHPSLTHSLSPSSRLLLHFFYSHTLSLSLLSPSPQTVTLCFIGSRCWQLREIECNMPRVWEKNLSDSLTNCSAGQSLYFLQTLNTGNVTQSSVWVWLLSPAWILLHINCHWLLSAPHLFIG